MKGDAVPEASKTVGANQTSHMTALINEIT
jgi:hypothetical protein